MLVQARGWQSLRAGDASAACPPALSFKLKHPVLGTRCQMFSSWYPQTRQPQTLNHSVLRDLAYCLQSAREAMQKS